MDKKNEIQDRNEEVEQWFSGVPAEEIDTSRRMLRGGADVGRAPRDH